VRVKSEKNDSLLAFIYLKFENLSQDGVLFSGFINGSLTGRQDLHNISHFNSLWIPGTTDS
jgi:hypothetical protein